MDISEASKKCSNTWCHRLLPLSSLRKTCDTCREKNRDTQKQSRARKKEKANTENIFNGEAAAPKKRRRNSSEETPSRPLQRSRHNIPDESEDENESDSDDEYREPTDHAAVNYLDSEEFFDDLKDQAKSGKIEMHASFPVDIDATATAKERAQMVTEEIRNVTGYRWTVKDHQELNNGHRMRLWCSQDEDHRKAYRPSKRENAKPRDYLGMDRFPCKSRLSVKYCNSRKQNGAYIVVIVHHYTAHVKYFDISMPPEAKQLVQEQAEWATPCALAARVRKLYPSVANTQVYHVWREASQKYWRRDDCELTSTRALLKEFPDEVELFDVENVPDGVEILAWGMKKIAHALKGRIVELPRGITLR